MEPGTVLGALDVSEDGGAPLIAGSRASAEPTLPAPMME